MFLRSSPNILHRQCVGHSCYFSYEFKIVKYSLASAFPLSLI